VRKGVSHEPFGTFSLPLEDWLIILGLAFSVAPVLEFAKWLERRGWSGRWRNEASRSGRLDQP
jgi:hypothetical protein